MKEMTAMVVACALVAGCGGGAAPADSPMRTAQATQLAAGAVSTQEAAEDLLDVAEVRYYSYFQGHSATQTSGPFAYRYYPATGTYLGVVVTADPQYPLNGVYVMGGSFGSAPQYVGPLSAFLNPVDLSSAGTNNGCFDSAGTFPAGTDIVAGYQFDGPYSGTSTVESVYKGAAIFQGQQTNEIDFATTSTTSAGVHTVKSYGNFTGDGEFTDYGWVASDPSGAPGNFVTSTEIYQPPFVDHLARLAVGQSVVQQERAYERESQTWWTARVITTYLGRETITVPAGTFETCKMEAISPVGESGSIYTQWFKAGTGILVQYTYTAPGTGAAGSTGRATSITRNGQPL
jgi:hypothetical protein